MLRRRPLLLAGLHRAAVVESHGTQLLSKRWLILLVVGQPDHSFVDVIKEKNSNVIITKGLVRRPILINHSKNSINNTTTTSRDTCHWWYNYNNDRKGLYTTIDNHKNNPTLSSIRRRIHSDRICHDYAGKYAMAKEMSLIHHSNTTTPTPIINDENDDNDVEPIYTAQEIADRLDDWKKSILPLMDDEEKHKLATWQSKKLQKAIRARIAYLVSQGNLEEARYLLDQVHDLHQSLLETSMYHPFINNADHPDQVSEICDLLLKHKLHMDLLTLRFVARAYQKKKCPRRLVTFLEQCTKRGQKWTPAMNLEVIKVVWPAQGKRYFETRIVPTQNKARIRQAAEIILWKYRVIVSKSGGNRNEMYRTVRIAHNFYDRAADRLKGTAAFLMMDMFCMAQKADSVIQIANTQPHPWTEAMYGLLIQAHRKDKLHALHWFHEMVKVCPNNGGFSVMLNVLAQQPKLDLKLIEEVHSTLINLCDTIRPDPITIQALITCYGLLGRRDKVLEILRSYHTTNEEEQVMDAANFQKALEFCDGIAEVMDEIIDMMMTPSIFKTIDESRWTSVLDTMAKLAKAEAATRVQKLVEQHSPDKIIPWSIVIKAWGEADIASSGEHIWAVYQKLYSSGNIHLDEAFCTSVLYYLCKSHNSVAFTRACALLETMEKAVERKQDLRIPPPGCDHYEPVLHGFLARSMLDRAKNQIDRRIELAMTGTNKLAEPLKSTYRQFVGAWVRNGKDLRLLTKTLVGWSKIYHIQQRRKHDGPDLVAYEMLFVGWDRALQHKERDLYKRKLEDIIRSFVRLGERNEDDTQRSIVDPRPFKVRRL